MLRFADRMFYKVREIFWCDQNRVIHRLLGLVEFHVVRGLLSNVERGRARLALHLCLSRSLHGRRRSKNSSLIVASLQLIGGRNRIVPAICVVLLSATFHEYVMIFALGFFYPVMFLLFGVVGSRFISSRRTLHCCRSLLLVVFLFLIPRNKGVAYNILVWAFLFIGVGLQSCMYFMEAYARKSCPANVRNFSLRVWQRWSLECLLGFLLG